MSRTVALAGLLAAVTLVPVAALSLPWDKDMVDQPAVKPQESPVAEPPASVPTDGKEIVAKPGDVSQLVLARVQAAALANPVPVTGESVTRGKEVYEIHCLTCHGATGKGEGLVGQKFTPPPIDLTIPYVQQMPDGQLFFTITHGSVVMPFYRDAIEPEDRWHVVNYVKSEW